MLRIQLLQRLDLGGKFSRGGLSFEQIALHRLKSLSLLNKLFSDLLLGHLCDIIPAVLVLSYPVELFGWLFLLFLLSYLILHGYYTEIV